MFRWRLIRNESAFSRFLKKHYINKWDVEEPKRYPCYIFGCADFSESVHIEFLYQEDLGGMLSKIEDKQL